MGQKDKQLLLVDLCGRFPYWVICDIGMGKEHTLLSIHISRITETLCEFHDMEDTYQVPLANVKPYLRPMSSMTEGEEQEYRSLCGMQFADELSDANTTIYYFDTIESFDWLNKKMFDYRGLIPGGLANEAPEGMYK